MESLSRLSQRMTKDAWLVSIVYLMFICALTWPMAVNPDRLIGLDQASAPCHVWILWWAQHHLGEFQTDLIFHPYGADVVKLYGSDLISPPLLALLPFSPVFLYNLYVVLLLLVGGLGARALASEFGAPRGGAFVAGAIFMSAPFFQHELLNGTSELISTGLLPWYTLVLFRILERPTIRRGVLIAIIAGLLLGFSAYNPFFMLLITICVVVHRLVVTIKPVFNTALMKASVVAMMVFAVFVSYVGGLHLSHGAGETFSRRTSWMDKSKALPDSFVELDDWFNPTEGQIPALMPFPDGSLFEYWTTCTVYLGWAALIALVYSWRSLPIKYRSMRIVLLVSMLIAMGPYLRFQGEVISIWGQVIMLPAATIGFLFPPFAITAIHAYRYTAVVVLCLSTLSVLRIRSPLWALLVIFEVIFFAPQPWPMVMTDIPTTPVLEQLEDLPDGAVVTLPMAKENLYDLGQMLLAQTVHGKPIHDGGIHRRAGKEATQLFEENFVLDQLSQPIDPTYPTKLEGQLGFRDLIEKGYRYALVPSGNLKAVAWAESILGDAVASDPKWTLWNLEGVVQ